MCVAVYLSCFLGSRVEEFKNPELVWNRYRVFWESWWCIDHKKIKISRNQTQKMFFSLRVSFSVLNVILVYARPENLFSYESTGSDWNEAGWNNDPLNDPLEGNLFSDSADLDAFASDFTLDSWDYASLPNSCDTQGSLTDDLLQARDDSSCPPKKKEENINLPTGLFQDPLQYLNDGLKTPPKGEEDRPGQESQGGDFNFGAFMNSRPKSALPYNVDESLCPPEAYGLSTTPVCHYPNRGLSTAVGATGTTLYDVSPCRLHFPDEHGRNCWWSRWKTSPFQDACSHQNFGVARTF